MLTVRSLHVAIDSVVALRGLSLDVPSGRMVGLVGRNGAGKTTLMRSLMGHLTPTSGSVDFDGHDLLALPPHARAGLGIGYMPEDRGLVPELTVEENILVPIWVQRSLVEADRLALVYRVLPELLEMRARRALLLSGGQQKLVALARALAAGTRLLLLDEPTSGVSAEEKFPMMDTIVSALGHEAMTVLFVEHDMEIVERYASRVVAFYAGRVIADGTPEAALGADDVRRYVTGELLAE